MSWGSAFADGYNAYLAGRDLDANPYKSGNERISWEEGWSEAQLADEDSNCAVAETLPLRQGSASGI